MKTINEKIKKFLDQRQAVLWEEHERVHAAKKLTEMFNKELIRALKKTSSKH